MKPPAREPWMDTTALCLTFLPKVAQGAGEPKRSKANLGGDVLFNGFR